MRLDDNPRGAVQEIAMRTRPRIITMTAASMLLVATCHIGAEAKPNPSPEKKADVSSSSVPVVVAKETFFIQSDSLPSAPVPTTSQSRRNAPKVELFLGYSYLRA